MKDFKDKVAVVTGAATGIGFALAKQLASHGAKLVIAARREDRLREAAEKLGGDVRIFVCDVTKREEVEALAAFAYSAFGRVELLFNNAGVGPIPSTVIDARAEDVRQVLEVNLMGTWHGVSVFGKRMLAQSTP